MIYNLLKFYKHLVILNLSYYDETIKKILISLFLTILIVYFTSYTTPFVQSISTFSIIKDEL